MPLWEKVIRPIAFSLDPERAHELAVRLARFPGSDSVARSLFGVGVPSIPREIWGLRFRNPVGLAAGFDKNGVMLPFLESLGFGFLEVGTVTLRPQSGNPKPRIFRYERHRALINRLGFNNDGAAAIAPRLGRFVGRETGTPLLVNIGRNKDVPNEEATEAYRAVYRVLSPVSHGVVVNISSPNTPGLRELQTGGALRELLEGLLEERERTRFETSGAHPILVKLSPDLGSGELETAVETAVSLADGIVVTNTTLDHAAIGAEADQQGGLSGAPLRERSLSVLRSVRGLAGDRYPIVGVGGIMDESDAVERIRAGADLIQLYTGFVWGGPAFPKRVVSTIARAASRE